MTRHNSDIFQAIADPSRREILMLLSKKTLSMNSLAKNFDISRPAVSKHVKVLHNVGLVNISEQGRERYCELNSKGFDDIRAWLEYYDKFWREKLQNLESLLNRQSKKNEKK